MFFKPDEIIQQYITTSVSKTKMSSIKIIAKSILAGLMIVMGAELFTGDCLMSSAVARRSISFFQMVRVLSLVFAGNYIGSFILSILIFF